MQILIVDPNPDLEIYFLDSRFRGNDFERIYRFTRWVSFPSASKTCFDKRRREYLRKQI